MQIMRNSLLKVLFGTLLLSSGVAEAKKLDVSGELKATLKDLKKKDGIAVEIKKSSTNLTMGTTKAGSGKLLYWSGKLRLEMNPPEQTLLVMDGKYLWLESQFVQDTEKRILVTKAKLKGLKKANALWATILGNNDIMSEFKTKNRKVDGNSVTLELVPKAKAESEIVKLIFVYSIKPYKLMALTYVDDRDNEVTYQLGEPRSIDGDVKSIFIYEPPKGANVTEI